jgi:hypothetical protein
MRKHTSRLLRPIVERNETFHHSILTKSIHRKNRHQARICRSLPKMIINCFAGFLNAPAISSLRLLSLFNHTSTGLEVWMSNTTRPWCWLSSPMAWLDAAHVSGDDIEGRRERSTFRPSPIKHWKAGNISATSSSKDAAMDAIV